MSTDFLIAEFMARSYVDLTTCTPQRAHGMRNVSFIKIGYLVAV